MPVFNFVGWMMRIVYKLTLALFISRCSATRCGRKWEVEHHRGVSGDSKMAHKFTVLMPQSNSWTANFAVNLSRIKGEFRWPPCCPDLSPLDYYFTNAKVWRKKPTTITALKANKNKVALSLSKDVLWAVMANFQKKAEIGHMVEGG